MTRAPAPPAPATRPGRSGTLPAPTGSGNVREPVPGSGAPCVGQGGHRADPATRRRRVLRLAWAVLAAAGRITLWTAAGVRTQRRVAVCSASGVLCALGVRVEVVNPAVPWPRTSPGHLVVSDASSWLDHLALVIAVRATPVAGTAVARVPFVGGLARRLGVVFVDRGAPGSVAAGAAEVAARLRRGETVSVGPGGGAFVRAAVDDGAPVCPVAIRYRLGCGPLAASPVRKGDGLARGLSRVVWTRELVVEVHLLPALDATGADRRVLARRAQDSVAGVLGAHPARGAGEVRRDGASPPGHHGGE